jgi:putative ABC transport system permease protein
LALAAGSVRLLSGMLYGVSAFDPITFAGVVGIVMVVAALATVVPAIRAARTDPMRVLRDE